MKRKRKISHDDFDADTPPPRRRPQGDPAPRSVLLPPGESPFDFIWPVRDQDIYLLNTSPTNDAYVREVVGCLFNAGAKSIQYVGVDTPVTEFKKGA